MLIRWASSINTPAGLEPPELVVVDGEEAITDMVTQLWPGVPIQRCWWHLPHGLIKAGYGCAKEPHMPWVRHMAGRLGALPTQALDREWTREEGEDAYDAFVLDVPAAYTGLHAYLAAARPHAMTFLDPRLRRRLAWLGGPELGTGVLERVMRELNARTDIGGSRWTVEGLRDMLTILTARLFKHPPWTDLTYTLRPDNTIGFDLCAA